MPPRIFLPSDWLPLIKDTPNRRRRGSFLGIVMQLHPAACRGRLTCMRSPTMPNRGIAAECRCIRNAALALHMPLASRPHIHADPFPSNDNASGSSTPPRFHEMHAWISVLQLLQDTIYRTTGLRRLCNRR